MALSVETLKDFFSPHAIAIIGASARENSIGWRIVHNILQAGYRGKLYPVNPKVGEILGQKVYPDILTIGEKIDLAFVALPAQSVKEALEQCAAAKVKYVILISAGFAETGKEGEKLQEYVSNFVLRTGIRVLGPNCQGMINFLEQVAVSFSGALEYGLTPGSIGLVAQSGALGHALFNVAQERGLGFAYLVTTGNEADLDTLDFLEYMVEDSNVKVVAGYVEGFKRPERLLSLGKRSLEKGKPVILLKAGKSEVARKAISSHTAALAGSDLLYGAIFRQAGIIRVNDLDELLDTAYLFSSLKILPEGNRMAILTTSGGTGVLLADACNDFQLVVPELAPETKEQLKMYLPAFGSANNPVDVTAQVVNTSENYARTLAIVINDPGNDVLLVGMGMAVGKTAELRGSVLQEVTRDSAKPVLVTWVASEKAAGAGIDILRNAGIPVFQNPWRCVRALSNILGYQNQKMVYQQKESSCGEIHHDFGKVKEKLFKELEKNRGVVDEFKAKEILAEAGFSTARELVVQTAEEAQKAAAKIGYPVVLKVLSPQILHKTECGGVKTNLREEMEVTAAFQEIMEKVRKNEPGAVIEGVIVQEMVVGGVEVILGVTPDVQLGPVVMFGLGGIYVELAKDVVFRLPPLTSAEAQEMIAETKIASAVLGGAREKRPGDLKALAEAISLFSFFVAEAGHGLEVDINPLIVLPEGEGIKIVDALIVKREK